MVALAPKNMEPVVGLSPKATKLVSLVKQQIAESPVELDGHIWAARSQDEWASLMGASVATVRRIISRPPFVRDRTHNANGHQITYLRIGEPGKKTSRHLANIMAQIFREETGRGITPRDYGCLIGCAEIWPDGLQIEIFRLVMKEWSTFMDGFRFRRDIGEIVSPNQKEYKKIIPYLKWKFPHLPTLRLGVRVAEELYVMRSQEMIAKKAG